MPTFRPSTPSASRSRAAAAVAILPTTRSMPPAAARTFSMVCITLREWACEVSMTMASTLAATRACTRSRVSAAVPTAAPTRSCPMASLQAAGKCSVLTMSLKVISPLRKLSLSTTGSFSMRLMCRSFLASAMVMCSSAVISPLAFMMVEIALAGLAGEAQVAVGQDADQLPCAVDDGQARDALLADQLQGLLDGVVGAQRDGVDDHARFRALDLEDLAGLVVDGEVLVDDGHAAQLGHGDGHARLGDGVHRRRHQRHAQADAPGKRGRRCRPGRGRTSE